MIDETSRRNVLRAGLGLLAGILVPLKAFAQQKIKATLDELKAERDTIRDLLPG